MAVGDHGTLHSLYPRAKRVDLERKCVIPGLIDAHGHLASLGALKDQLDLRKTRDYRAMVQSVAARAATLPNGAWIQGGRWDQSLWGMKEFPHHGPLSDATPDHPVLLSRVDGHAALANRKALALAGITRETKSPPGGEILHDESGEPTGMLIDNALDLVRGVIPPADGRPIGELWTIAQRACLSVGLTCVHDAGVARSDIAALQKLYDDGTLKLRAHVMLSDGAGMAEYLAGNKPARATGDVRFAVRSLKLYIDGAMGSRGAWMLEPYSDRPAHRGLNQMPIERLRNLAAVAGKNGWQVCTHAIGDRAIREVLDAYEAAALPQDHRFRVEHAQCIASKDIPRFGKLGVIASMQPTHATSDMRWAEDRVGKKRLDGCYAWRWLLSERARLAFGSDFPVESENPILGLYAAITRQDRDGKPEGGWIPSQRLTRQQALRLFTLDAAYAAFLEHRIGSLRPGKRADFVVLDRDIMKVPPAELLETKVLRTVIDGETVYER